jgi:hypothetical protein
MVDLPKELFEIGNPGERREYAFTNLKGEEEFVILNFGDKLTHKRCALDGAYIISYSGDPHTTEECPACKKYGWENRISSDKYLHEFVIPHVKSRIDRLKEELIHHEIILKLAQNPNNEIKKSNLENTLYNKANLSAQNPQAIIVNKSKAGMSYPMDITPFTKNSRLNH